MIDPSKLQPMRDLVLVRDLPPKPHHLGLVIIRENPELGDVISGTTDGSHGDYRHVACDGEVIAVGPGKYNEKTQRRIPVTVQPGDIVRYTAWNDLPDLLPPGFRLIQQGDIWGYPNHAQKETRKTREAALCR
jgi:co-chaperonin GroES (HSP10)